MICQAENCLNNIRGERECCFAYASDIPKDKGKKLDKTNKCPTLRKWKAEHEKSGE